MTGGTVTATTTSTGSNSRGASGIGGGYNASAGTISISGGYIIASGSNGGSSIGNGSGSSASNTITITGGYFGTGSTSADTVYSVAVATGYEVLDNPDSNTKKLYPYLVNGAGTKYTVTLVVENATVKADSDVTSYLYGTGATLPTDLSDFEYTGSNAYFDGWYTSSDYSGSTVTSIGADEYGDKTFYAKIFSIPTYTVTIPETVELGSTATVSASGVILASNTSLEVSLTGSSGSNNALTVTSSGKTDAVPYTLSVDGAAAISTANSNTVLSVPYGSSSGSASLSFSTPTATPKFTGDYTGTLTFTVSIKSII
ncbi:MAG: InlB B-repeat-containing protein [Clostridiales bacterium]|nr:InlB B-repeat-containing protein [Clostridiales bacterium]